MPQNIHFPDFYLIKSSFLVSVAPDIPAIRVYMPVLGETAIEFFFALYFRFLFQCNFREIQLLQNFLLGDFKNYLKF